MREEKKKRVQAKGWRVGTAKEFLGLSDEEYSYIELKLKLAERLRKQRQRRGLTQVKLAKLLNSSQSRVAKMEVGDPTVSIDLLIRSLLFLGASLREVANTISHAQTRPAA